MVIGAVREEASKAAATRVRGKMHASSRESRLELKLPLTPVSVLRRCESTSIFARPTKHDSTKPWWSRSRARGARLGIMPAFSSMTLASQANYKRGLAWNSGGSLKPRTRGSMSLGLNRHESLPALMPSVAHIADKPAPPPAPGTVAHTADKPEESPASSS